MVSQRRLVGKAEHILHNQEASNTSEGCALMSSGWATDINGL